MNVNKQEKLFAVREYMNLVSLLDQASDSGATDKLEMYIIQKKLAFRYNYGCSVKKYARWFERLNHQ